MDKSVMNIGVLGERPSLSTMPDVPLTEGVKKAYNSAKTPTPTQLATYLKSKKQTQGCSAVHNKRSRKNSTSDHKTKTA